MNLNMRTHIWILTCLCACVALTIFRMATYQFNMLHSPLESIPRPVASFLVVAARSLWHRDPSAPRRLIMWYLSSSLRLIFWNLHQAEGKKCTNKNNIIKLWNSLFIWAFRLHASHLFRAGKLIQFAVFASRLIQRPFRWAVKHAPSGRWFYLYFYFFFFCTLTANVSSYEISFINVNEQTEAAGKKS